MARLGGRPGPTLSKEIELESPYGLLRTTFGDVKNGAKGKIVSGAGKTPLAVKFDELSVPVSVPAHWAKIVLG